MIRLFVALRFPDDIRRSLAALCAGVPGARWARPDQFHLTLRFIGEVDGRTARAISEELSSVIMPDFDLELFGTGTFGDKRRANTLWAGVRPNPALNRLQEKVDNAMLRVGLPPDRRKFTPHVTLARLNNAPFDRIGAFLSHHALYAGPVYHCDRFVLCSSFLSSSGAIYTPEHVYRLDGGMAEDAEPDWMADEAEAWAEDHGDWDKAEAAAYGAE
ncbi:MAG: RNA 2',3'-cyclic phosphodiesterase [Ferrovibrio sp.]|uniref:RNA 2',3'-cyclic phosphodiesterase n=1 Tax=Ferrovibrio sp. TaxID=1917215 RepID=UPI00260466C4|nr:RNA 2',3'-cyclic phosphodiesterase [Ferrovibrio sp.]MCW0235810.1 RNA 2',3'-cyclic phosphodiesterase [Ferrovibrio sp.]